MTPSFAPTSKTISGACSQTRPVLLSFTALPFSVNANRSPAATTSQTLASTISPITAPSLAPYHQCLCFDRLMRETFWFLRPSTRVSA